jgi:hypothetical protein
MGFRPYRPIPSLRQEFIGRTAMILLGQLLGAAAGGIVHACFGAGREMPSGFALLLILVALSLGMVSLFLIVFAFAPSRDGSGRAPWGWSAASRMFDALGSIWQGFFNPRHWN